MHRAFNQPDHQNACHGGSWVGCSLIVWLHHVEFASHTCFGAVRMHVKNKILFQMFYYLLLKTQVWQ